MNAALPEWHRPTPVGLSVPAMRWWHLELSHRLLDDLHLPTPGSLGALYRSVFGLALHERAPHLFERFAGEQSDAPRPWWLWPTDLADDTCVPAGAVLNVRLGLHTSALPELAACLQAFEDFEHHGLGAQRSRLRLEAVRWLTPQGPVPLHSADDAQHPPTPWQADDVWRAAQAELSAGQGGALWVQTVTPLRLKVASRLVTEPPPLSVLLLACFMRLGVLLTLSRESGEAGQVPPAWLSDAEKAPWLGWSRCLLPDLAWTQRAQIHRWSSRQQRAIRMDGLAGAWAYPGEACAALPWLRLGEHLQLGGKTTVGMGAFHIHIGGPASSILTSQIAA